MDIIQMPGMWLHGHHAEGHAASQTGRGNMRAPSPLTLTAGPTCPPHLLLSVDGGARSRRNGAPSSRELRWVGAGAAIWGPADVHGKRPCWAQACLADPHRHDSMEAEAAGLRMGIALVLALFTHPVTLQILGDNLPIIRLASANGRLRADRIWHTLERPLMHTIGQGWQCSWAAVRRHRNKMADHLATRGTLTAVAMSGSTDASPRIWLWISSGACLRPSGTDQHQLPWHPAIPIHRADHPLCPLNVSR